MFQGRQIIFEGFVPPSANEARVAEKHFRDDRGRHDTLQPTDIKRRVREPRLPHGELLTFNAKKVSGYKLDNAGDHVNIPLLR
jgi:hypothetical protein